jgi:hypothetical protein
VFWRGLGHQDQFDAWDGVLVTVEGILQDNNIPLRRNTALWTTLQDWRIARALEEESTEQGGREPSRGETSVIPHDDLGHDLHYHPQQSTGKEGGRKGKGKGKGKVKEDTQVEGGSISSAADDPPMDNNLGDMQVGDDLTGGAAVTAAAAVAGDVSFPGGAGEGGNIDAGGGGDDLNVGEDEIPAINTDIASNATGGDQDTGSDVGDLGSSNIEGSDHPGDRGGLQDNAVVGGSSASHGDDSAPHPRTVAIPLAAGDNLLPTLPTISTTTGKKRKHSDPQDTGHQDGSASQRRRIVSLNFYHSTIFSTI